MSQDGLEAEPVDIGLVECQKENIEPLYEGRSARALAKAFSQDPPDQMNPHNETRQEFERLIVEADEQDDPLETYLDYIKWIKETYPQGHNGPSGLIGALERCTHHFRQSPLYKNDPRYLKVWLQYIKYNDSPKEVFNFLLRNEIGSLLAMFYENYAAYLETSGRITQAQQVYELGLENQAAPTERLHRRYLDFVTRIAAMSNSGENDPSSPLMRPSRAALSVISGDGVSESSSSHTQPHDGGEGGFEIFSDAKPKLQVFSDPDGSQQPPTKSSGGWDSIGSLASRRKENTIEARPWNGERMPGVAKQSESSTQLKIPVYRDNNSISKHAAAAASKSSGKVKRPEKLAVDLSLVYPEEGVELSFDEIRAKLRGLLSDPIEQVASIPKQKALGKGDNRIDNPTIRFATNGLPEVLNVPDDTNKINNNTKKAKKPKPEPTMTINTKAATDEIYSMFSQPLSLNKATGGDDNDSSSSSSSSSDESDSEDDEDDDDESDEDENMTMQLNKRISDQASEDRYEPSINDPSDRTEIEAIEDLNLTNTVNHPLRRHFDNVALMTPIAEKTETLTATIVIPDPPILEHPLTRLIPKRDSQKPVIPDKQCNPLNEELRKDALAKLTPSLDDYPGFNDYRNCRFGQFDILAKRLSPSSIGERTKNTLSLSFGESKLSYQVQRLLGQGAYGAVYLAYKEGSSGSENPSKIAIKAEKPANAWEFYILRQVEARFLSSRKSSKDSIMYIDYERVLESIARVDSFFAFKDEGYLTLEYISQGTILDLVNLFKNDANLSVSGSGVDERVAMFLTIELMRVVESLHRNNILHGDIKPDNCMIRFDVQDGKNNWSDKYTPTGQNGWRHKGIKLIDFGRSIDMTIFDPNVQFIADWKTDQQDCHEMRELRPWTYQVDYHGIASVAHCLLFGKYIETRAVVAGQDHEPLPSSSSSSFGKASKIYKLTSPFKRYWQQDLWSELFHLLLNSATIATNGNNNNNNNQQQQPIITSELASCRAKMELWLENNSHLDGVPLKASIRKIENLLYQQYKGKTR